MAERTSNVASGWVYARPRQRRRTMVGRGSADCRRRVRADTGRTRRFGQRSRRKAGDGNLPLADCTRSAVGAARRVGWAALCRRRRRVDGCGGCAQRAGSLRKTLPTVRSRCALAPHSRRAAVGWLVALVSRPRAGIGPPNLWLSLAHASRAPWKNLIVVLAFVQHVPERLTLPTILEWRTTEEEASVLRPPALPFHVGAIRAREDCPRHVGPSKGPQALINSVL